MYIFKGSGHSSMPCAGLGTGMLLTKPDLGYLDPGFQVWGARSSSRGELNDLSTSISALAQSISVLVMNEWINKPIAWNHILSPRTWSIISSERTGKNS